MDLKDGSSRQPQQIALKSSVDGSYVVTFVRNIIYIARYKDSNNTFVYYHDAFEGRLMCVSVSRISLSYFDDILPNQFSRADRSTIVNTRYVVGYTNDDVRVWTPEGVKTFPCKSVFPYIVEL